MTEEYKPEVSGQVNLSLQTYERWKSHMRSLQKERDAASGRAKDTTEAARHLSEFLNHISRKVDNFQDLVDAFNKASTSCEIQKDKDGRFKIKMI